MPPLTRRRAYSRMSPLGTFETCRPIPPRFWINHDKSSSDARRHAPEFYDLPQPFQPALRKPSTR